MRRLPTRQYRAAPRTEALPTSAHSLRNKRTQRYWVDRPQAAYSGYPDTGEMLADEEESGELAGVESMPEIAEPKVALQQQ